MIAAPQLGASRFLLTQRDGHSGREIALPLVWRGVRHATITWIMMIIHEMCPKMLADSMIGSRTVTVTQRLDLLPALTTRRVVVLFVGPDVGATVGRAATAAQHGGRAAHIVTHRGGRRAVWLTISLLSAKSWAIYRLEDRLN